MNRFLRYALVTVAVLVLIYVIAFALYLDVAGLPVWRSKIVWLGLFGAVLLAIAAWRLSMQLKFKIFAFLLTLIVAELLLQAAAALGVLPAVNTKLKAPYARVYWSGEGRGNSIRNRFGWNYPEFDLAASRRIALVGDSQVEAVEVHRTRNHAAVLHSLLRERSPDWSVIGLGSHGTSPAYSIDVLDYAARHFKPQEAIVVVSLGSDITEASPELNKIPADRYISYTFDKNGSFILDPASAAARENFVRSLELNHRSVFVHIPMILNSHCMTLQLVNSVRDARALRRRQAELAAQAAGVNKKEHAEYQRLGFNPAPFAQNLEPEARRAMTVLLGQLRQCQQVCNSNQMEMRLVTVPAFPKVFYDSQKGRDWTMQIGDYDYLKPEREIAEFARTHKIPVLSLGEHMRERKLDVNEIKSLYLSDGLGHLSEKGHRFCAESILQAFYSTSKL
jgi:hypothetical protein